MGKQICLDTGLITLFYAKDVPNPIIQLMKEIKERKIEAYIVLPIMTEVFYHICKLNGKIAAESIIASFLSLYPIKLVQLNKSLIIKAGYLKCKHHKDLSYNDCFALAFALNKKFTFHTTEKGLEKLFPNLKVRPYNF